jgi:hypothetical protein
MNETIVIFAFDGITYGLNRAEAELLCSYLFVERNPDRFELGGRIRRSLETGAFPLELTLDDAPVLRGVLDGAEITGFRGLELLAQGVGAEPLVTSVS